MFGYILVNPNTLSKDEKTRYREAYCGLCRQLRAYGAEGRAALSYDMTFIALLLNSVYEPAEERGFERCVMRPAPAHGYFVSEATDYAADMNVLLAYYKELDDWNDDRDRGAFARSKTFRRYLPAIGEKWPVQTSRVAECMETLSDIEKRNVLNPDEPANCFGALMGDILDWKNDTARPSGGGKDNGECGGDEGVEIPGVRLRRMGEALGRFLYLLDASNDLRDDIRKERYNPLIAQTDTNFKPLLTMMIGECTREFETLNVTRDLHLLRNVLYSGVWMKYRKKPGENAVKTVGGKGEDS